MARLKYLPPVNALLAAIFPVLFLYGQNSHEVNPFIVLSVMLVVVSGAVILLFVLYVLLRDPISASFVTCIWLVLFFAYGHVLEMVHGMTIGEFVLGRQRYLLPCTLGVAVLALWVALRVPQVAHHSTPYITAMLISLTVLNVITLPLHQLWNHNVQSVQHDVTEERTLTTIPLQDMPDIYYIILDGYAREDVLRDLLNFDNGEFLDDLRRNNFHVSSDSRTNYVMTFLALASALNMEYLDHLKETVGTDSKDRTIPYRLVRDNRVMQIAQSLGYKTVQLLCSWDLAAWAVPITYRSADERNADGYYIPQRVYPLGRVGQMALQPILESQFGSALLNTTMLRHFVARWVGSADAAIFSENIETLKALSQTEGPTFTFAHIMPPHPPYLFDRDGQMTRIEACNLQQWKEKTLYIDQLLWVNKSIKGAIDHILRTKPDGSVIVLQSDNGPEFLGSFADPDQVFVWERSSNLYATYLPRTCKSNSLYESITPVNTFRQIFNDCLGTNFAFLVDKTFWSSYERPYDFKPIDGFLR